MSSDKSIQIIEDGPIKASGFSRLDYAGDEKPIEGKVFLCRCGESQNKPYCDGSHSKVGFSGANEREKTNAVVNWQGQTIETFFNSNLCMHARHCKPLKDLRAREKGGDASAAQEIAQVVTRCPSGALTYEMKDGSRPIAFEDSATLQIVEGGEIRVQCSASLDGVELAQNQPANRVTLCRCGLSKNKPFCDASHTSKEGFK